MKPDPTHGSRLGRLKAVGRAMWELSEGEWIVNPIRGVCDALRERGTYTPSRDDEYLAQALRQAADVYDPETETTWSDIYEDLG